MLQQVEARIQTLTAANQSKESEIDSLTRKNQSEMESLRAEVERLFFSVDFFQYADIGSVCTVEQYGLV